MKNVTSYSINASRLPPVDSHNATWRFGVSLGDGIRDSGVVWDACSFDDDGNEDGKPF